MLEKTLSGQGVSSRFPGCLKIEYKKLKGGIQNEKTDAQVLSPDGAGRKFSDLIFSPWRGEERSRALLFMVL
jgi:hypothetical protein